jgi:hypothetical protein
MRAGVVLMRLISFILVSIILGMGISFGMGVSPILGIGIGSGIVYVSSNIRLEAGSLAVLLGTHTGAATYSGSIEQPIARLLFDADSTTALSTVTACKLTLTQATKRKTGTLIPEMTFANLADICGIIDGIYYQMTATFRIIFSIPISLGGAYDPEGGNLTYSLSGCTAADTINVYSIDDAKRELDYIEIIPVGFGAAGLKSMDAVQAAWFFVDPTNLTRINVKYPNGLNIEYTGAEIMEINRVINPCHKITDAGIITAGYGTLAGINVRDAVGCDVTLAATGTVYVLKNLLAG